MKITIEQEIDSLSTVGVNIVNHGFGNMYELYCLYSGYKQYIYTFYSLQDFMSARFVNEALKAKVYNAVVK